MSQCCKICDRVDILYNNATMPIGRLGRAEEIQVALFLASRAPQLVHGTSLVVDGAKTIFELERSLFML